MKSYAMSLACLWLVACGAPSAPSAPDPAVVARAATLKPSDTRLASLYAQSCVACHATSASGAPLTGDSAAWKARLQKGLPALVQSTVSGLNGMPAGGQCFACSADDYEALIRFMSSGEG